MTYNVWVITNGDSTWSSNSVDYASIDDAMVAGASLFDRWHAVQQWAVLPSGFNGHLAEHVVIDYAVGGIQG